MSRDEVEHGGLSPGAAALLEAWLATRAGPRDTAQPRVDADLLVRYLSGVLPAASARDLLRRTTHSSAIRRRLREVLAELTELERRPRAEVAAAAEGAGLRAEVARSWLEVGAECARSGARASELLRERTWAALTAEAAAGWTEAEAALRALEGLGRRLREVLAIRRVALARGPQPAGEIPGTEAPALAAITAAEVTADGTLSVRAVILGPSGEPTEALSGRPLFLELVMDGVRWPLDETRIRGSAAEFRAPGLGRSLGLPAGPAPAEYLAATLHRPAAVPVTGRHLSFPRPGPAGQPARDPVSVEVLREPECDGALLTVTLSLSPEVRSTLRECRLVLLLTAAASGAMRLAEWRIAELREEVVVGTVPCPGCPAGPVPLGTTLLLELEADEGG